MVQITEINIGDSNEYGVNKFSSLNIHYNRFIASWIKEGGDFRFKPFNGGYRNTDFAKWLRHLGLSEDEVYEIWRLATDGKFELEADASKFMKSLGD